MRDVDDDDPPNVKGVAEGKEPPNPKGMTEGEEASWAEELIVRDVGASFALMTSPVGQVLC